MSHDTEHALLEYGPNPTLQILIAKKKTAARPETSEPSQKKCAGGVFGHGACYPGVRSKSMLTEYTWQVPMSCGLGIARWRLPVAVLVRAACSSSTQSSTSDRRSTTIVWMLDVSCGVWAHDVPPRFFSRVNWMWHLTFIWDTLVKQQLSATPMQSAGVTTILPDTKGIRAPAGRAQWISSPSP